MSIPRKIRCTVDSIVDNGGRVYTVELVPSHPVPPFRPGQFLHLTVDDYDPAGFWPESRAFSIASSPRDRGRIRISYSIVGHYTRKMEQLLAVGGSAWIKLPYGDFFVERSGDVVLLAGGTGITAFTAFLESLEPGFPGTVYLAYGARTAELLIYRDLVRRCLARVSSLKVSYFVEHPDRPGPGAGAGTETDHAGRISVAAIWPGLERPLETTYYLSGPPAMLSTMSQDLVDRGVGAASIKTDAWE